MRLLREELERAALRAGRTFRIWTPDGPSLYNPFSHGSDSEIADKALAGEVYTEPHYLRQAQRYVGWAVRTLRAAGHEVTPAALAAACDPRQLELVSRQLPAPDAQRVQAYLDSLTPEQVRGLGGTRDRLAILAESDIGAWLHPTGAAGAIDLVAAVRERAVVYFRLDADRRPLVAAMLAVAIVQDLITVSAAYQRHGIPTLVMIDEFAAIAPAHVVRLFATARSAHMTMLLGTQELADLRPAEHQHLPEQVIGNLATVIAHRQNMPDSAEMIAQIAGTRGAWITTHKTNHFLVPSQTGTRTRGREFRIHPDQIKQLPIGTAAVIVPGNQDEPRITRMMHPREAT